jgi:hypothetical protein
MVAAPVVLGHFSLQVAGGKHIYSRRLCTVRPGSGVVTTREKSIIWRLDAYRFLVIMADMLDKKSTLERLFKSGTREGRGCAAANCRQGYSVQE